MKVLTFYSALSDPVDVYSDWVDACDSVAKEAAQRGRSLEYEDEDLNRPTQATDPIDDEEGEFDDPEYRIPVAWHYSRYPHESADESILSTKQCEAWSSEKSQAKFPFESVWF